MRASGILMHITSLPSPYGVGTMGKEAYRIIDFLHRAGQRCWQILPVTPTGYGGNPWYQWEEGDVWGTIRTAMASVSALCVIPMQDYLELGGEARMNFPGTQSGDNWTWRAKKGYLTAAMSKRIYRLTELYGRLGINN